MVGGGHKPEYAFTEALKMYGERPKHILAAGEALEVPGELAREDLVTAETSIRDFVLNEGQHSTYALALLTSMMLAPLVLASVAFLISCISTKAERLMLAHLVYPPILRKRNPIPVLNETLPPTRGRALLVLFIVLLNIVLSSVGYRGSMPNVYWKSNVNMIVDTLANRVGILAFANLPVIFVYSSRNNPLIRLTGWPYMTFIQLHRWVAYICVAQATLHSIIYFIVHIPVLSHKFTQYYWNVGIVGTTAFCLILPMSILFVRRKWYELFIDVHVTLALGTVIASYYHIYYKFNHDWGYENWIILGVVVWASERLARGFKIAANRLRTAQVLEVDDEYFVINVEGVKGMGMAYLYFPTLGWRLWENHPFSIMASVVEMSSTTVENAIEEDGPVFGILGSDSDSDSDSDLVDSAEESYTGYKVHQRQKSLHQCLEQPEIPMTPITPNSATFMVDPSANEGNERKMIGIKHSKMVTGLSFLIRREKGTTAQLFTKSLKIPVLVEGPYSSHLSLGTLAATVPQLVCIAGGVGIALILPILRARAITSVGSTRLYFGTRSRGLLSTCGIEELQRESASLDIRVRVQERWDLDEVVLVEAGCYEAGSHGNGVEILIVACGPASMIESARLAVVEANKRCRVGIVRLIDESFS